MTARNTTNQQTGGAPTIDIRRAADRFQTRAGWLNSAHSFSFGHHRDPRNTGHGLLLVNNDDVVQGGTGFETHPHRDMEIVTWVLDGELEHKDSEKNRGIIYPGLAQRMSAGRGILHSEMNNSGSDDVHFVQMWVYPDTEAIDPGYEQLDINAQLDRGGLVPIASGKGHDAAISIRQRNAVLWGGRLTAGERVSVPEDRHIHVFVPRGTAEIGQSSTAEIGQSGTAEIGQSSTAEIGQSGTAEIGQSSVLATGDAARLTEAGDLDLVAGDDGAEVLIWATA